MELTNEFSVGVPIERAWEVLTDLERIAPCLPGAQLEEVDGDEFRGVVKVKVGPITAQYKGMATFQELDQRAHRAVIKAEGRDTRGQGNAAATITATLEPDGGGTRVRVATDLTISGHVAQFGRGVLADVSASLMDQFVTSLEADVLSVPDDSAEPPDSAGPPAADDTPETAPTVAASGAGRVPHQPAEPLDLLEHGGVPAARRVGPVVGVVVVVLWLLRRRRKRRK